jgi:transcription-repair coupling factor (superfamily II helicase)
MFETEFGVNQAAPSGNMATQSQNTGDSSRQTRENILASALHQRFLGSPQYAKLLARTARHSQTELNLSGLSDSAKSLVLSVLNHEVKRPFFIIVQDNQVASRLKHELSNLSRYPVYFYPSSEVSPYEQVLSSPDNIAPQLEVLNRIMYGNDEPYLVIVPIRALIQRVLDAETLKEKSFALKKGATVDREDLARRLAGLGYSRESLVTLRGEFSIRGDIIDIYPSSGFPMRIELFDNEVESIRQFNIDNQRSVDELNEVLIPPRYWIVLDDTKEFKDDLIARLREHAEASAENWKTEPRKPFSP